ncbi:lysosomal acid glucosylceramidase-like isoform X1 [Oratosquilla oratoria]|uniref:lysosomal acid glucosylceramidase-like isoform X1 n=1 Tax=Oratosquilla oratoria TaxID=337810 RepID=UPI003F759B1A
MRTTPPILLLLLIAGVTRGHDERPCVARNFGHSSFVCVCNSTYCDKVPEVEVPLRGEFAVYTSSLEGARFQRSQGEFSSGVLEEEVEGNLAEFELNYTSFQTILGWGTAITDAATINLLSLSTSTQEQLLRAYFSEDGIGLNIGRINMGGCDFSTRTYTYDDIPGDVSLEHFALQEEDLEYKIPTIHRVQEMSPRTVKLFASPWSAPKWMKTNNDYVGFGRLKDEMYQPWADYFKKFLDQYAEQNVSFWGLTAQNEPFNGYVPGFFFNCMGWTAEEQRDWIVNNLGPTLAADYSDVKLMIMDDQRFQLPQWPRTVLGDPDAAQYVSGIAVHWYWDWLSPNLLTETHEEFPEYFILGTEASIGDRPLEQHVAPGSWERFERYAEDIIEDMNHWVTGWTDWNFALDLEGGPNWARNFVDSSILVDKDKDEFYKNPMYYALGHFSKFVPEGSRRIQLSNVDDNNLSSTAFTTPDGTHVLVVLNRGDVSVSLRVSVPDLGVLQSTLGPRSMQTILFV